MGEMRGSGFEDSQWLVRLNGRYIQLSEVLFRIAAAANGKRAPQTIARKVTHDLGVRITGAQVQKLIDAHLTPVGVIRGRRQDAPPPGGTPTSRRSLLGLTAKTELLTAGASNRLADGLKWLFTPLIVVLLLAAAAAAHVWLYVRADVGATLVELIQHPTLLLPVLAIYLVAATFHELGHAAALRYAGGDVRGMGIGMFLVYPAFYTDVTDSYRLSKGDRVRTGLGGIYFHVLASAAFIAAYVATGASFFAVSVLLINAELVRQFFPFVRLDGYWILADLTGIPDLFTQMTAMAKRRSIHTGPRLRPWVKRVFITYMALIIPTMGLLLATVAVHLPAIAEATGQATSARLMAIVASVGAGDWATAAWLAMQLVLGALPLLGVVLFGLLLARRLAEVVRKWIATREARKHEEALSAQH